MPLVKFRRYGNTPSDVANYFKDRHCGCHGPFHRCRNTDVISALQGCKCNLGRVMQMGACPCEDDPTPGEQVALDPGFEDGQFDISSPLGNIPQWYTSYTTAPDSNWGQESFLVNHWEVVSTDPDSGTYHARAEVNAASPFNTASAHWIQPIYDWDCQYHLGYSAVVIPGDLVTFSVRAKASQVATGNPQSRLTMDFHDIDWGTTGSLPVVLDSLTTSYATYSCGMTAPSGSKFVRCFYWPFAGDIPGTTPATDYDFDNVEVSVL